jgi:hypothetical protein
MFPKRARRDGGERDHKNRLLKALSELDWMINIAVTHRHNRRHPGQARQLYCRPDDAFAVIECQERTLDRPFGSLL